MLRFSLARICSSTCSVVTADAISEQLTRIIGGQKVPLASAQSDLPEEMQEVLGEEFGGLLSFARERPDMFTVSKSSEGLWQLQRAVKPVAPSLARVHPNFIAPAPQQPATIITPKKSEPAPREQRYSHPNANLDLPAARVRSFPKVTFKVKSEHHALPTFALPASELMRFTKAHTIDELLDALRDPICSGAVLAAEHNNAVYVSPAAGAGTEQVNPLFAAHEVPYFDLCRAARHLSCDRPTRLVDLDSIAPMLSRPLAAVVMSAPKRFHCEFVESDWREAIEDEPIVRDMRTSGSRCVLTEPELTPSVQNAKMIKLLHSVTYMVDPDSLAREAPCAKEFENHTYAELRQLLADFSKRGDKKTFKAVKEKRRLIRSLISKRFPLGNPLIDPDVTAMLIFDNIEHVSGFIHSGVAREMLPENGKIACQTGNDFFRKFPHLFNISEKSLVELYIQRADCAPPPRNLPLSQPELMLCIVGALPSPFQPNHFFYSSFLASRLTYHVLNELKRQYGSVERFLDEFPQTFDHCMSKDNQHMYASTPEKIRKWESLALKGLADAEYGDEMQ